MRFTTVFTELASATSIWRKWITPWRRAPRGAGPMQLHRL